MAGFQADAFAAALVAARAVDSQRVPTPAALPMSTDDAYAVQDVVRAKLGPAAAWKVGAANASTTPTCAPILARGLDTRDARTSSGGQQLGVELEIAFRIGRDFAAADYAPTSRDVKAAIEGAYIAIETCLPRLADGLKSPPLAVLADSGINHGLVLGPRVDGWPEINASTLRSVVTIDGATVADTTGGHTHGGIFDLLVWQVGHCVTRRGGLAAGSVITTGSWMGIVWSKVPARITGTFPGYGSMTVSLEAGH